VEERERTELDRLDDLDGQQERAAELDELMQGDFATPNVRLG
jgi:hypothetical protein